MTGRPSSFSDDMAERICDEIADGKSLRTICESDDFPDRVTVIRWLGIHEEFATKYAHAREAQGDFMDEQILAVADGCTVENAAAARVKIDAYRWRAAKLAPKRYGDKLALEHSADDSLRAWMANRDG